MIMSPGYINKCFNFIYFMSFIQTVYRYFAFCQGTCLHTDQLPSYFAADISELVPYAASTNLANNIISLFHNAMMV